MDPATWKCPNCSRDVAARLKACPKCESTRSGAPASRDLLRAGNPPVPRSPGIPDGVYSTRELVHSEKMLGIFTTERARDRANARRAIEGLNQNDAIIALLLEQNEVLRDIRDQLRSSAQDDS